MSNTWRPKFRVGDRIMSKENIHSFAIIKKINRISYIVDDYFNEILFKKNVSWSIDLTDDEYTLDLNHYIKNL